MEPVYPNKLRQLSMKIAVFEENKNATTIAEGSTNRVKIQAVKNAVADIEIDVIGYSASSNVRAQPLSEEETRHGAMNRAQETLHKTQAGIAIGLEAGVFFLNDNVYLCHWGALVDRNENRYLTNGPIFVLPNAFRKDLLAGHNLEEIMHHSTGIKNLGSKEGAIGIFTGQRINREKVLTEAVKVLLAQYDFYHQSP